MSNIESKEYLEWCKKNNLDSSLVKNYNEYQNEMEYQDYLNSIYDEHMEEIKYGFMDKKSR